MDRNHGEAIPRAMFRCEAYKCSMTHWACSARVIKAIFAGTDDHCATCEKGRKRIADILSGKLKCQRNFSRRKGQDLSRIPDEDLLVGTDKEISLRVEATIPRIKNERRKRGLVKQVGKKRKSLTGT